MPMDPDEKKKAFEWAIVRIRNSLFFDLTSCGVESYSKIYSDSSMALVTTALRKSSNNQTAVMEAANGSISSAVNTSYFSSFDVTTKAVITIAYAHRGKTLAKRVRSGCEKYQQNIEKASDRYCPCLYQKNILVLNCFIMFPFTWVIPSISTKIVIKAALHLELMRFMIHMGHTFRCLTKGPDVTAAFLKGHFCELSSNTVTVGELSIFTQTTAVAFIEHNPITITATIEP
ncbi:hypothetical protein P5673_026527 [Acropora cervicornis]|uniref:Uncharacterized protein n=1 Tax=Acropora cervicornis TaxID=6130 RepID=A0AAD9UWS4_ACRCE|nr:hypothetical protein P5673_026527 [Acropora cervicornis]